MARALPALPGLSGEPALYLAAISATVSLIVTFNVGMTDAQGGLWVALITAVFAAVTAWHTRPFKPALLTGLASAAFALLAGYHFNVPPDVIAQVNMLILALFALVTRHQVAPLTKADLTTAA